MWRKVKKKLHFASFIYVEGPNNGRGFALFWRYVNTVRPLGFSKNFIDTTILHYKSNSDGKHQKRVSNFSFDAPFVF